MGRSQNARAILFGRGRISKKEIFKNSDDLKKELPQSRNSFQLLKENITYIPTPADISNDPIFSDFFKKESKELSIDGYNLRPIKKKYIPIFLEAIGKDNQPRLIDIIIYDRAGIAITALENIFQKDPSEIERICYSCEPSQKDSVNLFLAKKLAIIEIDQTDVLSKIDQTLSDLLTETDKLSLFDAVSCRIHNSMTFGQNLIEKDDIQRIVKEKASVLLAGKLASYLSGCDGSIKHAAESIKKNPELAVLKLEKMIDTGFNSDRLKTFFLERSPGEIESLFGLIGKQAIFRNRFDIAETISSIVGK